MAKPNRTFIYLAVVALGVVGFLMTDPGATGVRKSGGTTKRTTKKSAKLEVFIKEDMEAKFARLNEPVKNSFKPLVFKASGSTATLLANQIPTSFTGGKTVWTYTGTVVIDDVPMALVEETGTQQGEYLKVGDVWKFASVLEITPNSLTMAGPDGSSRKLVLIENRPIVPDSEISAPVNPLSGPIGLTARSDQNAGSRQNSNETRNANNDPNRNQNNNNVQNSPD